MKNKILDQVRIAVINMMILSTVLFVYWYITGETIVYGLIGAFIGAVGTQVVNFFVWYKNKNKKKEEKTEV